MVVGVMLFFNTSLKEIWLFHKICLIQGNSFCIMKPAHEQFQQPLNFLRFAIKSSMETPELIIS